MEQIATVLREYENFCYQIAFYLLEQEEFAITAAKQALLELGQDQHFLAESAQRRKARAKRVAIHKSLEVGSR